MGDIDATDSYVGMRPLAHILELLAENLMLTLGIAIGYSSPNTLTDTSTMVSKGSQECLLNFYKTKS